MCDLFQVRIFNGTRTRCFHSRTLCIILIFNFHTQKWREEYENWFHTILLITHSPLWFSRLMRIKRCFFSLVKDDNSIRHKFQIDSIIKHNICLLFRSIHIAFCGWFAFYWLQLINFSNVVDTYVGGWEWVKVFSNGLKVYQMIWGGHWTWGNSCWPFFGWNLNPTNTMNAYCAT